MQLRMKQRGKLRSFNDAGYGGAYSQYVSATSSTPSITVLKSLATYGKSVIVKVDLSVQTTEGAIYIQSQISQTESNFTSALNQAYKDLTGSAAGIGQKGSFRRRGGLTEGYGDPGRFQ